MNSDKLWNTLSGSFKNRPAGSWLVAAGAFAHAQGQVATGPAAGGPYNIVLIVSDDHGLDALGCYGNPVIQTPNLDRLAAEGTRFTHAFCTTASSAASRSAILTGLHNHANGTYGHTHGHHHFSLFDDVLTLPAMLQKAGYRTGRAGKKHYAPESLFPFDFDPPEYLFERDDVQMARACRSFIRGEGPFFLYWASWNPHPSGGPVRSHPLRPRRFGNPETSYPGDQEQRYSDEEVIVPPFLNDTPEARAELAQYYQSIARLDRGIGELLRILEEEGKYENTVILYISDNGPPFPMAKASMYDPGINLPLIVRSPDQRERGVVTDALVTWVDITPTVLDFAGVRRPTEEGIDFHGRSFREVLEEPSPKDWREEIYASHTFHELTSYYPMRVVRSHRYKFIWNIAHRLTAPLGSGIWNSITWQATLREQEEVFGTRRVHDALERPEFELYDLHQDPGESVNLADHPEYRDRVEAYQEKLRRFQEETSDPWRIKWEYE